MQIRPASVRPGLACRARAKRTYPLPPGLHDGTPLEVVHFEEPALTVKDRGGNEWNLFLWQVDPGREFREPSSGNWLPESHPEVLAAIRSELRRNLATSWPPALAEDMEAVRRDAFLLLARNGEDLREFPELLVAMAA